MLVQRKEPLVFRSQRFQRLKLRNPVPFEQRITRPPNGFGSGEGLMAQSQGAKCSQKSAEHSSRPESFH
ncbi:hypothetical protein VULLAG_LOCUS525 [Vulpes lagopus]